MALNNAATILPGRGTVFVGEPGVAPPDYKAIDPLDESTYPDLECIGHTSRDNTVALSKDGGDATQIGSWWDEALRTSYESTTWGLTVNSLQVDALTLGLAFGGGTAQDGYFAVSAATQAVNKALFVLCVDTSARMGLWFPNTPITIGDAPEIAVDKLFEVQLSASVLTDNATGERFRIYHPALDAVTP